MAGANHHRRSQDFVEPLGQAGRAKYFAKKQKRIPGIRMLRYRQQRFSSSGSELNWSEPA